MASAGADFAPTRSELPLLEKRDPEWTAINDHAIHENLDPVQEENAAFGKTLLPIAKYDRSRRMALAPQYV
jgi:hypothetical protein